jgi:hypothetical protein
MTDASLVILSEKLSAAELQAMIGLTPDRSWESGDPIGRSGHARQRFSGWRVDVAQSEQTAESQISALFDRIRAVEERIAAVASDPRVHSVALWVTAEGDRFALELAPSRLLDIARLGATLKVNAYDIGYV